MDGAAGEGGGILLLLLLLALALVRFTKKEWRPGNVFVGWDMVCVCVLCLCPVVLCVVLWGRRQITCDDACLAEGARERRQGRRARSRGRH
jgi:hypothetical protein